MKSFADYELTEKKIKDMTPKQKRDYEKAKRDKANSRERQAYHYHDTSKAIGIEKPEPKWHKDMKAKAQAKKDDRASDKAAHAEKTAKQKADKDLHDKSTPAERKALQKKKVADRRAETEKQKAAYAKADRKRNSPDAVAKRKNAASEKANAKRKAERAAFKKKFDKIPDGKRTAPKPDSDAHMKKSGDSIKKAMGNIKKVPVGKSGKGDKSAGEDSRSLDRIAKGKAKKTTKTRQGDYRQQKSRQKLGGNNRGSHLGPKTFVPNDPTSERKTKKNESRIHEDAPGSVVGNAIGINQHGGSDPYDIQNSEVLKRVNAFVGSIADREYLIPENAVGQLQGFMERIGLSFDMPEALPESGSINIPLKRYGGVFGKSPTTDFDKFDHEEGIDKSLNIQVESLRNNSFKVYAKIA